jgi:hypothetical protein
MAITINGTGSITGLTAGGLPDGSITAADIETSLDLTGKTVTLPSGTGGKILQVVQVVKTDTASTTSTSWSDISGLSVSITPTSASSKILVRYDCTAATPRAAYSGGIKLQRNGTDIFLGDAAGSRTRATSWVWSDYYDYTMWPISNQFLDSPATTSSLIYKLQFMSGYSGFGLVINRNWLDSDAATHGRVPSQITVMEVSG